MPLPELGLSLSTKDSPYLDKQIKKITSFDSAIKKNIISITISDQQIGTVEINVENNKNLNKIHLPTYSMKVTDDKTNEVTFYQVTRDSLILDELKLKQNSGFSLFGFDIFKQKKYILPLIGFEPENSSVEKFEISKYRTKKENYIAYTLKRKQEQAILFTGKLDIEKLNFTNSDYFLYVVDFNDGQKFIGDISYREKFIKSTPLVEMNLIKRKQTIKEIELNKSGKISKIIYL